MINRLEYMREYRKKNKEKLKEYFKNYYKENKEKLDEYAKKYREENKEEYKEYYRTYMREVYYPKHRDEITAYQRQLRRMKNEARTL